MLFHHNQPQYRVAGWAFICLIALFAAIATSKPVVGFSGLGAVLILMAITVEANKEVIWKNYLKQYKKTKKKGESSLFNTPNELYYKINVYVVWPVVLFTGLLCIYTAFLVD